MIGETLHRHLRSARARHADDETELELEVDPLGRAERRCVRAPSDALPVRPAHRRAAHDDGARTTVVGDREPTPTRYERLAAGTEHPSHVRRVLERRVEVDIVGNLERQVHRDFGVRRARTVVRTCSRDCFVPCLASERHERIERRPCVDITQCREVDDLVSVTPADPRRSARAREDPEGRSLSHERQRYTGRGRAPRSGSM